VTHRDGLFAFVLGTRPEIIKLSPLIRECQRRQQPFVLIHTGQHYMESMDTVFFEQLELPAPEYHLGVGSGSHGEQTGEMVTAIETVLLDTEPDIAFVQGDTNTALAGGLAASKLDTDLAHVEAGLRSFDRTMPEERNRVLVDHVSEYLFAPTDQSRQHLLDEGRPESQIYVTGNTVVDAVARNRELAKEKSSVLSDLRVADEPFFLLTAHRAETVDDRDRFQALLTGVADAAAAHGVEVVYPIHPRAQQMLEQHDMAAPDPIRVIEPQDYLDFLRLETAARIILTDSGGVQEEACILHQPCVTLRETTERPETLLADANRLVGTDPDQIRSGIATALDEPTDWDNPFGDGTAAETILSTVRDNAK